VIDLDYRYSSTPIVGGKSSPATHLEGFTSQPPLNPTFIRLGTPKILIFFYKSAQKILKITYITINESEITNINLVFSFYIVVAKSAFLGG
jgi:hypothetical protein